MKVGIACLFALAACTRPNPAVCCLDPADCEASGFDGVRPCAEGLACVDHQCEVASCSTQGCAAAAPVCNIVTDVCEGCTQSSDCSRFAETSVCEASMGACVQCVTATDCSAGTPICELNQCRACRLDAECPSGACGEDGTCISEDAIAYLDPAGTDVGECTNAAPCRTFAFAVRRTSSTRNHLVLRAGEYAQGPIRITPEDTAARPLHVHGGGATVTHSPQGETFVLDVATGAKLRDLVILASGGNGLSVSGPEPIDVDGIVISRGYYGLAVTGAASVRRVRIEDAFYGVVINSGQLTLDAAVISGGQNAIFSGTSVNASISNTLIYGTSDLAVDLFYATGAISYSTIADSGASSGTGAKAVRCNSSIALRASIVWAPGGTRPVIENCILSSSIIGPVPAPGASNADPRFVDAANRDYHLSSASEARDALESGPPQDVDGDSRPQGGRFDIGADEAVP